MAKFSERPTHHARTTLRATPLARFSLLMFAGLLTLLFSGCDVLPGLRADILDKANGTVEKVGYQLETTKISIDQKVQEVRDAAQKVEEAKRQLDEATKRVQEATDAVKNLAK